MDLKPRGKRGRVVGDYGCEGMDVASGDGECLGGGTTECWECEQVSIVEKLQEHTNDGIFYVWFDVVCCIFVITLRRMYKVYDIVAFLLPWSDVEVLDIGGDDEDWFLHV